MKKSILFVLTIVLLTFFFVQTGLAADAEYKIRCSLGLPDQHFMTQQFKNWAGLIEEKTNGRVDVKIFYSGQLYKDVPVIEAIQVGAVEAGNIYSNFIETIVPEFGIFNLPLLYDTTAELEKIFDSRVGRILVNKAETKGLKILGRFFWPQEDIAFVSTKQIKVPEDLKGLKVRATASAQADWLKTLGAAPVYISGSEMYMGFQRGTLDAALSALAGTVQRKLYEVADYTTFLGVCVTIAMPTMNKKYFDKLPEDIQQAILEASAEMNAKSAEYAVNVSKEIVENAKELKVDMYFPTEEDLILWRDGIRGTWRKSLAKQPGALLLADEVLDLLGKADYFK